MSPLASYNIQNSTLFSTKNSARLKLYLPLLIMITGCIASPAPSELEAQKALTEYYSFYEHKEVSVKNIKRGDFIKECKCYPVEFEVTNSMNQTLQNTFYLFKQNSGAYTIKKYKFSSIP